MEDVAISFMKVEKKAKLPEMNQKWYREFKEESVKLAKLEHSEYFKEEPFRHLTPDGVRELRYAARRRFAQLYGEENLKAWDEFNRKRHQDLDKLIDSLG